MDTIKLEESIFNEVLACGDSAEARDACLAEHCGENLELRRRVEQLLQAYTHPDEIFEPGETWQTAEETPE